MDKAGTQLLYGPYITSLAHGDYVAFYRLERTGPSEESSIAQVDAVTGYGQETLNLINLQAANLPINHHVQVPLPFHYQSGKLEVRLLWTGYAPLLL